LIESYSIISLHCFKRYYALLGDIIKCLVADKKASINLALSSPLKPNTLPYSHIRF